MTENTFLIIDASNLIYRAAYANSTLTTSKGKFSGHIFGSVSSLLAVLRNQLNDLDIRMCFCYDGSNSKEYRRTILPEYKTNRTPRETNPLPEAMSVLKLWPGIHVEQKDKEGDDAMAYAVHMRQGKPCVVLSGDRDLWSLMQFPNCKILSPNLKRFVEPSDIYEAYHLTDKPEGIPLAKALFGDSSDGIKGVERLTKKQVEPYLNEASVKTPQDFYNALGDTRPQSISVKNWEKLIFYKDKVFKNYQVILPQLDFDKSSVTKVDNGFNALKQKLIEYECFSLLNQLEQE